MYKKCRLILEVITIPQKSIIPLSAFAANPAGNAAKPPLQPMGIQWGFSSPDTDLSCQSRVGRTADLLIVS